MELVEASVGEEVQVLELAAVSVALEAEVQVFQPAVMTVTTVSHPPDELFHVDWVLPLAEVPATEVWVLVVLEAQEVLEVRAVAEPRPVPVWDWGLVEALVLELEQA